MPKRTVERRATRRRAYRTHGLAASGGRRLQIVTADLSLGGARLHVPATQRPAPGAGLSLYLPVPGFGAEAVVRWVAPQGARTAAVGVQFHTLDFSADGRTRFIRRVAGVKSPSCRKTA